MVLFATISLVITVAEQILFGTWELTHFFYVFKGTAPRAENACAGTGLSALSALRSG